MLMLLIIIEELIGWLIDNRAEDSLSRGFLYDKKSLITLLLI